MPIKISKTQAENAIFERIMLDPELFEWVYKTQLIIWGAGGSADVKNFIIKERLTRKMQQIEQTLDAEKNHKNLYFRIENALRKSIEWNLEQEDSIKKVLKAKLYAFIFKANLSCTSRISIDVNGMPFIAIYDLLYKEISELTQKIKADPNYKKKKFSSMDNQMLSKTRAFKKSNTQPPKKDKPVSYSTFFSSLVGIGQDELVTSRFPEERILYALLKCRTKIESACAEVLQEIIQDWAENFPISDYFKVTALCLILQSVASASLTYFGFNGIPIAIAASLSCGLLLKWLSLTKAGKTIHDTTGFLQQMQKITQSLEQFNHLQRIYVEEEPIKAKHSKAENKPTDIIYTPFFPGTVSDEAVRYENYEPDVISGYRLLLSLGYSKEDVQQLKQAAIDMPETRGKEQFSSSILFETYAELIRPIANCPNTYLYLDQTSIQAQLEHAFKDNSIKAEELKKFKDSSAYPKFCGAINEHGLKPIPPKKGSLIINNEVIPVTFTHELKAGGVARIFCCKLDCKDERSSIYIACWYSKVGLHNFGHQKSHNQNKACFSLSADFPVQLLKDTAIEQQHTALTVATALKY